MKGKILRTNDEGYPVNLTGLADAPGILYVEGEVLPSDSRAVAIVGTREMDGFGERKTKEFASFFSALGFTIISGLAEGVDTVAHTSALEGGGRTIAILAGGLDRIYPKSNIALAKRISKNGALLSEYPSGREPLPRMFLQRNRIVSGLALFVVVIQGRRRSGTLSTARHAAYQGRDVFVLEGSDKSELFGANRYLAENGAQVVRTPRELLDKLS